MICPFLQGGRAAGLEKELVHHRPGGGRVRGFGYTGAGADEKLFPWMVGVRWTPPNPPPPWGGVGRQQVPCNSGPG